MPDLTDKSRANLAAGGKTGPGTDVCQTCGGPKEPSRLNSFSCKPCASGPGKAPFPRRPVSTPVSGNGASPSTEDRLDRQATAIKQLREDRDALLAWAALVTECLSELGIEPPPAPAPRKKKS